MPRRGHHRRPCRSEFGPVTTSSRRIWKRVARRCSDCPVSAVGASSGRRVRNPEKPGRRDSAAASRLSASPRSFPDCVGLGRDVSDAGTDRLGALWWRTGCSQPQPPLSGGGQSQRGPRTAPRASAEDRRTRRRGASAAARRPGTRSLSRPPKLKRMLGFNAEGAVSALFGGRTWPWANRVTTADRLGDHSQLVLALIDPSRTPVEDNYKGAGVHLHPRVWLVGPDRRSGGQCGRLGWRFADITWLSRCWCGDHEAAGFLKEPCPQAGNERCTDEVPAGTEGFERGASRMLRKTVAIPVPNQAVSWAYVSAHRSCPGRQAREASGGHG